ncbi:MAG: prepilin-type N-terminal cleavage/methylation domain-containing protein [Verrucomicrobiia bacterium]
MKLLSDNLSPRARVRARCVRAFTLTEMMVTLTIFLLVVTAMVSLQIFGFRINSLTTNKSRFIASSLYALDQIQCQVRNANVVVAGNGTNLLSFQSTATNGNALMIYPPTGAANLLYLATNNGTLYEIYGTNNRPVAVAHQITNQVVFQTVDCNGNNISSTSVEHYAIRMTLNFFYMNYRIPTNIADYYTFQTEMTPRLQD